MKRVGLILIFALIPICIYSANLTIHLKNGAVFSMPVDEIKKITFADTVSEVKNISEINPNLSNIFISPNPANNSANLSFCVNASLFLKIQITDFQQNLICELASGNFEQGNYQLFWNGKNSTGLECSSGIYFCRFIFGKNSIEKKIILLR